MYIYIYMYKYTNKTSNWIRTAPTLSLKTFATTKKLKYTQPIDIYRKELLLLLIWLVLLYVRPSGSLEGVFYGETFSEAWDQNTLGLTAQKKILFHFVMYKLTIATHVYMQLWVTYNLLSCLYHPGIYIYIYIYIYYWYSSSHTNVFWSQASLKVSSKSSF